MKYFRARQAKWDAANLATTATKLTKNEYGEFRAVCASEGVTPYAVIRKFVRVWVQDSCFRRWLALTPAD